MVNETIAELFLESCKNKSTDQHPDTTHLFWSFRQAPPMIDFAFTAIRIEQMKSIALLAPSMCGDKKAGAELEAGLIRIYDVYRYGIDAWGSEGGRMIKTMQTQVSEHSQWGNIVPQQKEKGVSGFFKSFGQKKVI